MVWVILIGPLLLTLICLGILWLLAFSSVRIREIGISAVPQSRFAVAIPAHNEEEVIGRTVALLRQMDYPPTLFEVYVVADFCDDRTAERAREQGALCFDRQTGDRGGKSTALRWLFEKIFERETDCDAIIVFDADTEVDPLFLKRMDARLVRGDRVIQGRHVISNPHQGWFPSLSWVMMTIDNRFNNQGRETLGLSAKHMGDSICFKTEVLKALGWGSGLTEDYEFRLRLLQEGIRIAYEPGAVGYGQAPLTWGEARVQRLRWLKGVRDARQRHRRTLLRLALAHPTPMLLDGMVGSLIPSYTTLSVLSVLMGGLSVLIGAPLWMGGAWGGSLLLCFLYPFFGLALERAPWWAYWTVLSGPVFLIWRIGLVVSFRLMGRSVTWVRTPHRLSSEKTKTES